MRTSVEISDSLLRRARSLMARRDVTLRALIEEGLRRVIQDAAADAQFTLRDAAFDGPIGFALGRTEADVSRAIAEFNDQNPSGLP